MSPNDLGHAGLRNARPKGCRSAAFSLVELLTVVFIISLLIGVLLPSIGAARNSAKKATTSNTIRAITVGLEMFKSDNDKDFRLTNGYPPSFAHPKIPGFDFLPYEGRFPFLCKSEETQPVVYGAHWLPAMLMGADKLGYVKKSSVPRKDDLRKSPWLWYPELDTSCAQTADIIDRQPFYLDPGNTRLKATEDLPGRPPESSAGIFPDWEIMKRMPVIVDAFDQPILYYVASTHGKMTNMVETKRLANNAFIRTGPQLEGVPFYYHQDNEGFTGNSDEEGWNFGGRQRRDPTNSNSLLLHPIAEPGDDLSPPELIEPNNRETFARYIIDRNIWATLSPDTNPSQPIRPVNADTFLLISASVDGLYGTSDDVSNMPRFSD